VILHAGLVARFDPPWWRGVLLEGPSGAGKSDLALRLMALGWALVADDRCEIWISDGRVYGRAAEPLKGLIEIRGLGVGPVAARDVASIALVARCVDSAAVERIPDGGTVKLLDQSLPLLNIAALQASAPMKLGHALTQLGLGR
jgi:serine kinase of HPr protein (carbohydrate metabolism regulator)